jgi:thioredoxin-dependent peroxiredoxin
MKHLLIASILFTFFSCNAQTKQLDVGDTVPKFTLKNQDGKTFSMKDSIGKKIIVIFFYPKDESMVCTKEACGFRDSAAAFTKAGALVIGINNGTVESHKKFVTDFNLPYQLLSDPDQTVIAAFGVKGKLLTDRVTYVVDKTGQIVFKYHGLTEGKKHPEEVLQFLREMKK